MTKSRKKFDAVFSTHTPKAASFLCAREDVGVYDDAWRRLGGLLIDGLGDLAQARPLPG